MTSAPICQNWRVAAALRALAAELRADVVELLDLAVSPSLCSMYARTTPAVDSGRRVRDWAFSLAARARSSQVNISLLTMSVSSPTPRAKSSVVSKIGVRISPKP